jgi:hypothetical protein
MTASRGRGGTCQLLAGSTAALSIEIALRIAEGRSNPEIAERLGISRFTARNHAEQIFVRLKVESRWLAHDPCRTSHRLTSSAVQLLWRPADVSRSPHRKYATGSEGVQLSPPSSALPIMR